MKAYVLINVRTGSIAEVVRNLRRLEGVSEADMTFGPYDAIAIIQADDVNRLGHLIATQLQPIPGILDTLTCLVVEP
ncbi:MAG TPA: Lrp/AsnC ligand binding domain-containing protein [Anaerolineales bacterium]|nr:Lrp/AsnC ligand binding domain-containing protein [Anaerolineales bacterium]